MGLLEAERKAHRTALLGFGVFFFPLYKKYFEAGINLPDLRAQQIWHGYFFG